MKSSTGNIKSDLEFSKNLIDNLVSGKSNPVEEAGPKLSDSEKQEMTKLSEAVGEITGMDDLVIKSSPAKVSGQNSIKETSSSNKSLISECIDILEKQSTPDAIIEKMLPVLERHERTEKILLQFLKKYR